MKIGLNMARIMLMALLTSGCVTGSTYRNNSTPTRLDVAATDQAAVEAGQSQVGAAGRP
jgi:hypothetical protein